MAKFTGLKLTLRGELDTKGIVKIVPEGVIPDLLEVHRRVADAVMINWGRFEVRVYEADDE